jgi:quercetin dioxygenase-like cupin family protein
VRQVSVVSEGAETGEAYDPPAFRSTTNNRQQGEVSMRKTILVSLSAALAASTFIPLHAADAAKKGNVVLTPAAELKWVDVPGFPVKMAAVQGDPAKGANHTMQRLPGGFEAPLHHHTSDHFVTVVSGTLALTVDGKETKLPPGSYFEFKGKKPHITKCEAGADCVLSVDARGKWDVVPEGEKAAAKKK